MNQNPKKSEKTLSIVAALVSVVIGLIAGWYLLFLTNATDSLAGLGMILFGGFTRSGGIGQILFTATPIILTGLAVGFSFKTGLFNIGASGQLTVGAFTSIYIVVCATSISPAFRLVLALIGGMAAGAAWGMISGALKAYFNVNEVISCIMLNYIAMFLVNMLIKNSAVYDSSYNRTVHLSDNVCVTTDLFNKIFPGSNINFGIVFAVVAVVIIAIILDKTTLGYELKICGYNKDAGLYAGISYSKSVIISMAISGALAGLGGVLLVLSDYDMYLMVEETVLSYGFTGISVAMLGMSAPVGCLIAGLFIGVITVGGSYLQLYGYTPDVVDMIIAIIVYCGAFALPLKILIQKIHAGKQMKKGGDA